MTSISTLHVATLGDGDNQQKVKFNITSRSGATPEMVQETVLHFCYGLTQAILGEPPVVGDEWRTRTNYFTETAEGFPLPEQARVNIYADNILIPTSIGMVKISVNVCDEYTSALALITAINQQVAALVTLCGYNIDPAWRDERNLPEAEPDKESDLPTPAPAQETAPAVSTVLVGDKEIPYLGGYDFRKKAEYTQYNNQLVVWDVREMRPKKRKNREGKMETVVEIFSSYNGYPSKFAAGELTQNRKRLGDERNPVDEFTKLQLQRVLDNDEVVEGNFRGIFKIFVPEEGKLFPLLRQLEIADDVEM